MPTIKAGKYRLLSLWNANRSMSINSFVSKYSNNPSSYTQSIYADINCNIEFYEESLQSDPFIYESNKITIDLTEMQFYFGQYSESGDFEWENSFYSIDWNEESATDSDTTFLTLCEDGCFSRTSKGTDFNGDPGAGVVIELVTDTVVSEAFKIWWDANTVKTRIYYASYYQPYKMLNWSNDGINGWVYNLGQCGSIDAVDISYLGNTNNQEWDDDIDVIPHVVGFELLGDAGQYVDLIANVDDDFTSVDICHTIESTAKDLNIFGVFKVNSPIDTSNKEFGKHPALVVVLEEFFDSCYDIIFDTGSHAYPYTGRDVIKEVGLSNIACITLQPYAIVYASVDSASASNFVPNESISYNRPIYTLRNGSIQFSYLDSYPVRQAPASAAIEFVTEGGEILRAVDKATGMESITDAFDAFVGSDAIKLLDGKVLEFNPLVSVYDRIEYKYIHEAARNSYISMPYTSSGFVNINGYILASGDKLWLTDDNFAMLSRPIANDSMSGYDYDHPAICIDFGLPYSLSSIEGGIISGYAKPTFENLPDEEYLVDEEAYYGEKGLTIGNPATQDPIGYIYINNHNADTVEILFTHFVLSYAIQKVPDHGYNGPFWSISIYNGATCQYSSDSMSLVGADCDIVFNTNDTCKVGTAEVQMLSAAFQIPVEQFTYTLSGSYSYDRKISTEIEYEGYSLAGQKLLLKGTIDAKSSAEDGPTGLYGFSSIWFDPLDDYIRFGTLSVPNGSLNGSVINFGDDPQIVSKEFYNAFASACTALDPDVDETVNISGIYEYSHLRVTEHLSAGLVGTINGYITVSRFGLDAGFPNIYIFDEVRTESTNDARAEVFLNFYLQGDKVFGFSELSGDDDLLVYLGATQTVSQAVASIFDSDLWVTQGTQQTAPLDSSHTYAITSIFDSYSDAADTYLIQPNGWAVQQVKGSICTSTHGDYLDFDTIYVEIDTLEYPTGLTFANRQGLGLGNGVVAQFTWRGWMPTVQLDGMVTNDGFVYTSGYEAYALIKIDDDQSVDSAFWSWWDNHTDQLRSSIEPEPDPEPSETLYTHKIDVNYVMISSNEDGNLDTSRSATFIVVNNDERAYSSNAESTQSPIISEPELLEGARCLIQNDIYGYKLYEVRLIDGSYRLSTLDGSYHFSLAFESPGYVYDRVESDITDSNWSHFFIYEPKANWAHFCEYNAYFVYDTWGQWIGSNLVLGDYNSQEQLIIVADSMSGECYWKDHPECKLYAASKDGQYIDVVRSSDSFINHNIYYLAENPVKLGWQNEFYQYLKLTTNKKHFASPQLFMFLIQHSTPNTLVQCEKCDHVHSAFEYDIPWICNCPHVEPEPDNEYIDAYIDGSPITYLPGQTWEEWADDPNAEHGDITLIDTPIEYDQTDAIKTSYRKWIIMQNSRTGEIGNICCDSDGTMPAYMVTDGSHIEYNHYGPFEAVSNYYLFDCSFIIEDGETRYVLYNKDRSLITDFSALPEFDGRYYPYFRPNGYGSSDPIEIASGGARVPLYQKNGPIISMSDQVDLFGSNIYSTAAYQAILVAGNNTPVAKVWVNADSDLRAVKGLTAGSPDYYDLGDGLMLYPPSEYYIGNPGNPVGWDKQFWYGWTLGFDCREDFSVSIDGVFIESYSPGAHGYTWRDNFDSGSMRLAEDASIERLNIQTTDVQKSPGTVIKLNGVDKYLCYYASFDGGKSHSWWLVHADDLILPGATYDFRPMTFEIITLERRHTLYCPMDSEDEMQMTFENSNYSYTTNSNYFATMSTQALNLHISSQGHLVDQDDREICYCGTDSMSPVDASDCIDELIGSKLVVPYQVSIICGTNGENWTRDASPDWSLRYIISDVLRWQEDSSDYWVSTPEFDPNQTYAIQLYSDTADQRPANGEIYIDIY